MEVLGAGSGKNNSAKVWIENHPTQGWVPGTVDSIAANGKYIVVDEDGEQFEIEQDKARQVDSACLKGVDDLLALGDFNEGALLHNVRVRYFKDEIYTGIGGPILISMNPFAKVPGLYDESKQKFYRDASAAAGTNPNMELPPHLFSVAASSYTAMLGDGKNQSIIISGESGAGKTEATKRILTYFANLQRSTASAAAKNEMSIEDQVLRSNPILEAFGNAKTLRNDNSSRFGKYIDIEFDTSGKLQSARISNYLLEKSRIVKQQPDERGYHAFYFLCAAARELEIPLHLMDARDHAYTCGTTTIPGVDDRSSFQEMVDCMGSLGFTTEETHSIFKITAAVLHMGDMEFQEHANSADGCKICDATKAEQICGMLHVNPKDFTKVFQFKTLEDPFTKKTIDMPQDPVGSSNTRHAMAKAAYSRLFDWLIWRINQSTMGATGKARECRRIGILDIYGFEVFDWNSFEQLCINFANEKLQQHFNSHMFTLEQQLYSEEGISWSHIHWQDNREIIENLEKKPMGVFCILDSECLMPNATDNTCLSKILNSFKTSKIVYKPSRFASTNFAVAHYAGEVIYDIISFLEKNTDKLHADIINLLKTSDMPLLKSLFSDPRFAPELAAASKPAAAAPKRGSVAPRAPAGGERAKNNVTVSMMFRQQLDQLVEDLNKTNPRYIRCIKPNANKAPHDFDSLDVQRQLRCAGMLESIRIRRAGYSVRRPFKEFYNRFRVLCPNVSTGGKLDPDYKELCRKILAEMDAKFEAEKRPLEAKSYQLGRSKVFMKEELQSRLEECIHVAIKVFVICVQKRWRGYSMKKRYAAMKKGGLFMQAALRTLRAALEFRTMLERTQACCALQASLRTMAARRLFERRRGGARKIQKVFRGWICRRRIGKLKGKMAQERIQKMREEEDRRKALEEAKKAADEQKSAMEEMKKQLAAEREKAQADAAKQIEEAQRQKMAVEADEERKKREQERAAEQQQAEKVRQEMLDLRKENARLQGELECRPAGGGASSEELEHLKQELQTIRHEKVKLEVDMVQMKSAQEFEALVSEVSQLRGENSNLQRAKLDAEVQLEQRSAQLDTAKAQAARAEQASSELSSLRSSNDELQVQFQRLQAQKTALEQRVQSDDGAQAELRELRLEKMRLEGDLETARMREQAVSQKLKDSEKAYMEMHQTRQKMASMETELEASKKHVDRLTQQMKQMTKEGSNSRTEGLDQLRSELLSRLESKAAVPSSRPSIMPGEMEGTGFGGIEERKTLMNQRDMFEQLKKQFNDANSTGNVNVDDMKVPANTREAELEEELHIIKRENIDLNIRITSLQDELKDKGSEASQLLSSSSMVQAELADLRFRAEQEAQAARRAAVEGAELRERLLASEGELSAARRRQLAAEEQLVRIEEEFKGVQARAVRLDEERESFERRARELQIQASDAIAREREAAVQLEQTRLLAEEQRKIAEQAERTRIEKDSSSKWLETENDRLKLELQDANNERLKIRQVVDDLLQAERSQSGAELQKEAEKWKARAAYYEREYQQSKQLNNEMTKVMSQMTQAVSERSDETTDVTKQNKMLLKQLDVKGQELRAAKMERDEVQKQLDGLHSQGSYFQEKYREACDELRTLRQEHSVSTATSSKLKLRVESLQKESDDLKAQMAKVAMDSRANSDDGGRVEKYEQHVRELQIKLRAQDEELDRSQAFAAKSQAVNDCLNTLLVLESEQTSLYEMACPITDQALMSQFESKRSKAQNVINRLNEIMSEEERPSIAFLQKSYR